MRVNDLRGDGYHAMRGGIQETGLCHREGTSRGALRGFLLHCSCACLATCYDARRERFTDG